MKGASSQDQKKIVWIEGRRNSFPEPVNRTSRQITKINIVDFSPNIVHNDNRGDYLSNDIDSIVARLFNALSLDESYRGEFSVAATALVSDFQRRQLIDSLPERPVRDLRPREGVIEYIRSPEGLAPWLEAGLLTRPAIRKLAPKAYVALANWLRANTLESVGLDIPTQAAVTDRELDAKSTDLEALTRLVRAKRYRTSGQRPRPEPAES